MLNELLRLEIMLNEQAVDVDWTLITDLLSELGCIYEDTDHYPTLPYSVEELAEVLDLGDISEADESVIEILEEIVISEKCYSEEVLRWTQLQQDFASNF